MELEGEKAVLQERLRASEAGYQALLTKLEPSSASSADKLSDASAAAEEAAAAEGGGGAARSTAVEEEVGRGGASAVAGKRVGEEGGSDQEDQEEEPTYEVPLQPCLTQSVFKVVLHKSIPPQILQLVLYYYSYKE
jgi:hypothetical protein